MLLPPEIYVQGILNQDIAILARAITIVESNKEEHQQLSETILKKLVGNFGNSFRLGITGPPGVGKSTFIESFGLYCIEQGHKIAVLAIDPSSTSSKGSLLGDKTRMAQLSKHPHAFIRPSPSGGILGGVASKTYETMLLCEAAGFDWIFIETVGVGQSEIDVAHITDFFLLLMMPASGDDIQGIKRGIMEIADGIVITKADGDAIPKAQLTAAQFKAALHYFSHPLQNWQVPVIPTSAITRNGLDTIYNALQNFLQQAKTHSYLLKKRQQQQKQRLEKIISEYLTHDFFSTPHIQQIIQNLTSEEKLLPHRIAKKLIQKYKNTL